MIITFDTSKLSTPFKALGAKLKAAKLAVREARLNVQARKFVNDYEHRLAVTKRAIELSKDNGELAAVFIRAASMDKHEPKKPRTKVVKLKPAKGVGTSRLRPAVQPGDRKQ